MFQLRTGSHSHYFSRIRQAMTAPKATYTTASLGAKREADKIAGWIQKNIMTWDGQPGSANYITLFAYKLCFYRTPKYEYVETGNTYSSISGRTKKKNTARGLGREEGRDGGKQQ